uniref:Coiled-coil domain containing 112 n=1 Tax=Kryptolebias marmoratus TaxID=37003 RepID=A0A3Q3BGS3_KRYMA
TFTSLEMHLQKQLAKIQNGVRKFQVHLTDVKPTPELIEKLKEIMSEVELSINTVKEEQRLCFEEYLKEERTCRQEVNAYEKKIENWNLAVKSNSKLPTASTLKVRPPSTSPQRSEPWRSSCRGQVVNMEVWTKHSGQPSYRKEAKLYLPGKTLEEIEQHEDWHQELLSLKDKKRGVENCGNTFMSSVLIEERRRQLEVKLALEEHLRLKREEEEEQRRNRREEEQREMEERQREAAKSIKCFSERVKHLQISETEKTPQNWMSLFSVDGHINRDPSRLIRPTKGWQERMKHIGPSGDGPLLQMFHRAVPSWRQGL